jgi:hypothetical protein
MFGVRSFRSIQEFNGGDFGSGPLVLNENFLTGHGKGAMSCFVVLCTSCELME